MRRGWLLAVLAAAWMGCSDDSEGAGGAGGSGGGAGSDEVVAPIEITSPAHGTFVDENLSAIDVDGVVRGIGVGTSTATLTVNGETVAFDASDGTWSTRVALQSPGVPQSIEATLDPGSGALAFDRIVVMRGPSIAKGTRANDAAFIQVTDAGFDVIEPVALELLPIDFSNAVPEGAVVLEPGTCVFPVGDACLVTASAVVNGDTQVEGEITVAMDAQPESILVDMSVSGVSVPIAMSALLGELVINCEVTATLGTLGIQGSFELQPDAIDPALVDVVQSDAAPLSVSQEGVEIVAESCEFEFLTRLVNLLAGAFAPLVQSGMESFLEADLPGTDDTPIAGAIEAAMATIKVGDSVGDAIAADVDGVFRSIVESSDDVLLSADTDFAPACAAVAGAPAFERSSAPPTATEPLPLATPDGGVAHHIALALTPTGFNQVLRTMTECGLLVADITELTAGSEPVPLTTQQIGLIIPALRDEYGEDEPVRVELRPTIAPFVTGAAGPKGELLEMIVPHLVVDFVLPDVDEGDGLLALSIAVDINSQGVNLVPSASGNELGFSLAAPDESQIAVFMLANPFGADPKALQGLLPTFLPGFLNVVVADIPPFTIPEFAGLTLTPVEVSQSGGAIGIFTTASP